MDVGGARGRFLELFANRDEKPTEAQTSILQALTLMNGQIVSGATSLEAGDTLAAVAEAPYLDTAGRVEELYLAALTRKPRPDESALLVGYIEKAGTPEGPLQGPGRRLLGDPQRPRVQAQPLIRAAGGGSSDEGPEVPRRSGCDPAPDRARRPSGSPGGRTAGPAGRMLPGPGPGGRKGQQCLRPPVRHRSPGDLLRPHPKGTGRRGAGSGHECPTPSRPIRRGGPRDGRSTWSWSSPRPKPRGQDQPATRMKLTVLCDRFGLGPDLLKFQMNIGCPTCGWGVFYDTGVFPRGEVDGRRDLGRARVGYLSRRDAAKLDRLQGSPLSDPVDAPEP